MIVKTQADCIIHYLCVKNGFEGLGHATKMINTAFKDKDIADKRVHCVTQLSYPYKYCDDCPANHQWYPCTRMFYSNHKSIKQATTEDCAGLVFLPVQLTVTDGNKLWQET